MDKVYVEKSLENTDNLMRKEAITRLKLKEKLEPREVLIECRKCEHLF